MAAYGTRHPTEAKLLAEKVRGVRAVGFQHVRGKRVLMIAGRRADGSKVSREVDVSSGMIADTAMIDALRAVVGIHAARGYAS